MKNLVFVLISILIINVSCDDGDVVVTTFNFDESDPTFEFCTAGNTTVFYTESETNEIMTFELNSVYNDSLPSTRNPISVDNGRIIYRSYTTSVNADDLFCQAIAPVGFNFDNELISNRGQVVLFTEWEIDPEGDDDNDGLLNRQEGISVNGNFETQEDLDDLLDTDNDGIPNFRDDDDDNDNVKTIDELARDEDTDELLKVNETEGVFRFTIASNETANKPDHLNDDDDEDGIKTFNEVKPGQINPLLNEIDGELNLAFRTASFTDDNNENDDIINQDYRVNTRTFLRVENLGLTNGETTVIREEFLFGENSLSYTEVVRDLKRSEIVTPTEESTATTP